MQVCVPSMCEPEDDDDEEEEDAVIDIIDVSQSPEKHAASVSEVASSSSRSSSSSSSSSSSGVDGGKIRHPNKFFALRWNSVVVDNSDELLWSYAATPILSLSE